MSALVDKLRQKAIALQWWLTLVAAGVTLWLVYALLFAQPSRTLEGVALLPKPTCANGTIERQRLDRVFSSEPFRLHYTIADSCNQIQAQQAIDVEGVFEVALKQNGAVGLSDPALPVEVALVRNLRQGPVTAYPSPGGRGAIMIDVDSNQNLGWSASLGLAELSLADWAPGLSRGARRRVAGAFAYLTHPEIISAGRRALYGGTGGRENDGLYDAWLASRFGISLLNRSLNRCGQRCSWQATLNSSLRAERANPRALFKRFTRTATPGLRRDLLRARLARD